MTRAAGNDAGEYAFSLVSSPAYGEGIAAKYAFEVAPGAKYTITKRALTITAPELTKGYDGGTGVSAATIASGGEVSGAADGESLTLTVSGGSYPQRDVGSGLTIDSPTFELTAGGGAKQTNYEYTLPAAATGSITAAAITDVDGVTVVTRRVDGTTDASFDTTQATGTGVVTAELGGFRSGLKVNGSFPEAARTSADNYDVEVTYTLGDAGTFKSSNYVLSDSGDTLKGAVTTGPAVGFATAAVTHGEAAGDVLLTVNISPQLTTPSSVTIAVNAAGTDTAAAGSDYTAPATALTLRANVATTTLAITVTDDAVSEGDERFTVTLTAIDDAPYLVVAPTTTVTITDDDQASRITLAVDPSTWAEDAGKTAVQVTATLAGAATFATDTEVVVAVAGSGVAGAVDFAPVAGFSITIPAAQANGRGTFTLIPVDDAEDETDATLTVSGTASGMTVTPATLTLRDDDPAPPPREPEVPPPALPSPDPEGPPSPPPEPEAPAPLRYVLAIAPDVGVPEGDSGSTDALFTVTLSPASELPVSVRYATAAGTATAGRDYAETNGTLRFAPGEAERTILVAVHGDETPEADETFTVALSDAVNAELETARTATGTIVDDDAAVLAIAPGVSVAEGDGGSTDAPFTVTLRPASELPVSVRYATAAGTATAGRDYAETNGTLRFAPGEAERTILVAVHGDETPEADETFTVALSDAVNAELETAEAATGTIVDDDAAVLAITPEVSVPEGDGGSTDALFTVTLSPASELPVSVKYATAAGTATAGADYLGASGTLTFAPGETEQRIRVAVRGDATPEADETFTVALSDAVNAELETAGTATGTIVDDDVAVLAITPGVSVPEGDRGSTDALFTVTLSPASELPVSVKYATAAGTATAGADYLRTSGELTFAPGETEQRIRVAVRGDEMPEPDERFTLTLGDPVNAQLGRTVDAATLEAAEYAGSSGPSMGTVTIMDDDRERMALRGSLSILGRIVAMDAVDTIGSRFSASPRATKVNLVGTDVAPDGAWEAEQIGSLTAGLLGLNVGSAAAATDADGSAHDPIAGDGAEVQALTARPIATSELLSGSAFDLRLNGPAQAEEMPEGDEPSWVLWGRGSVNRYQGPGGSDLAAEGDITTAYVGVERRSRDLLLGLTLSLNWGDLRYTWDGTQDGGADQSGTVRAEYLVNALPYGSWSPVDGLDVWVCWDRGWDRLRCQVISRRRRPAWTCGWRRSAGATSCSTGTVWRWRRRPMASIPWSGPGAGAAAGHQHASVTAAAAAGGFAGLAVGRSGGAGDASGTRWELGCQRSGERLWSGGRREPGVPSHRPRPGCEGAWPVSADPRGAGTERVGCQPGA